MSEHDETVIAALHHAPEFENVTAADCKITRLGGLTNLVHLVETGARKIIVRIPGEGAEEYIDRTIEATMQKRLIAQAFRQKCCGRMQAQG